MLRSPLHADAFDAEFFVNRGQPLDDQTPDQQALPIPVPKAQAATGGHP
jgi:hypothetical protein